MPTRFPAHLNEGSLLALSLVLLTRSCLLSVSDLTLQVVQLFNRTPFRPSHLPHLTWAGCFGAVESCHGSKGGAMIELRRFFMVLLILVATSIASLATSECVPFFAWSDNNTFVFLQDMQPGELLDETLESRWLDYPAYQILLELQSETSIEGTASIRYKNRSAVPMQRIYLHLFPNMLGGSLDLLSASTDGLAVDYGYAEDDTSLCWIELSSPLEAGQRTILDLSFAVSTPDQYGDVVDVRFRKWGPILSAAYSFPIVADFRGGQWDTRRPEIEGEFSFREHALFAVRIDAPVGFEVVASGMEVGEPETSGDGSTVSRFFVAGPCNDFYWGGSSEYVLVEDRHELIDLQCYVLEGARQKAPMILQYAKQALAVYSSKLTPYPYKTLTIAVVDYGMSLSSGTGGAEFTGLFTVNEQAGVYVPHEFGLETLQSDSGLEMIIAHEMAHQWFAVSVASDPVEEPWIDEGLAQLATWLYMFEMHDIFGFAGFEGSLRVRAPDYDSMTPIALDKVGYGEEIYSIAPLVLWGALTIDMADDGLHMQKLYGWLRLRSLASRYEMKTLSTEELVAFVARIGEENLALLSQWLSKQ